jgi:hypothetical protein
VNAQPRTVVMMRTKVRMANAAFRPVNAVLFGGSRCLDGITRAGTESAIATTPIFGAMKSPINPNCLLARRARSKA